MTAARDFARYLSGIDPATQVPPLGLMPHRARWRQPFIYTTADINTLLEAARNTIASPLRAATYQTLIGLLASSGLRIGEAIKLDRTDIDWAQGCAADPRVEVRQVAPGPAASHQHAGARLLCPAARRAPAASITFGDRFPAAETY